MSDNGIPWLTDPQRDFLAHLTVLTIQPQLEHEHPYDDVADALGDISAAGEVRLLGDQEDVYVIIHGRVIVHAARDWLEYMTPRWASAESN